jgi:tRNA-Thr(GGU) m(6)t(6)A37 methyltransferase TsaA
LPEGPSSITSDINLVPIGRVESPLTEPAAAPKQAEGAPPAWLVFDPRVRTALRDLRVGDDVIVLTWLDRADRSTQVVHPQDDTSLPLTGVFATRSSDRPNPVGVHPARIVEVQDLRVRVDRLEAIDGTPIVDVKPVLRREGEGTGPGASDASGASGASAVSVSWGDFASSAPELAAFGADRLLAPPVYLATIRRTGTPRVHPVTPIIGKGRLFVFMEPTSPKRRDLLERRWYALHNGVPDTAGTGGEFSLSGTAVSVDDSESRAVAVAAASYEPAERYVLFELLVSEARANAYGDVAMPDPSRWRVPS